MKEVCMAEEGGAVLKRQERCKAEIKDIKSDKKRYERRKKE
jgi:hypothetical protein